MINPPIGVAIAGLGFGESVHLPALSTNKDLTALSLWHPQKEKLESACKKHNLSGQTSWAELLKDPQIDAIILATPPAPRFELALQALKAKKHLLLEKPVALNAEQVAELQKLAINQQLSVAVDFEYRAVPHFMQAKRIISSGAIGTPWLIKFDWLMGSRSNPSRCWDWYSQEEKGGGVIGALGTHAFDILHWFFGPTNSISSLLSTSITKRTDKEDNIQREVTSEDVTMAQLQLSSYENESLIPAQVTLSAVAREGRGCWLEVYGSQGTLLLGSDNQKDYVHGFGLWVSQVGEQLRSISPDKDLAFSTTWSDGRIAPVARLQGLWAESIRTRKPMIPGLAEGWFSQKVCDKAKESSSSGQRLYLD